MTLPPSPFEDLQGSNTSAEIWWDSSPLVFSSWRERFLSQAPSREKEHLWRTQLDRFFDPDRPTEGLVRGITTNPSLIANWIQENPEEWRPAIFEAIDRQHRPSVETTYHLVYGAAIAKAAKAMLPMWNASAGTYGWVSGQTDPRIMFDERAMLDQALSLAEAGPNVMLKIPGTAAGYRVIEELTARGISTNSTLSYTVPQFVACIQAVERGLAKAYTKGIDTSRWRSVITHMIGRFGAMSDLHAEAAARGLVLSPAEIRWAEIAILKRAQAIIQEHRYPTKMLLSSLLVDQLGTPGSNLSMHLEHTAGADIAYTCKPDFIAEVLQQQDRWQGCSANAITQPAPPQVLEKLLMLPSFRKAYDPEGMMPLEFAATGAFLGTFIEVNKNIQRLIHHIGLEFETSRQSAFSEMKRTA